MYLTSQSLDSNTYTTGLAEGWFVTVTLVASDFTHFTHFFTPQMARKGTSVMISTTKENGKQMKRHSGPQQPSTITVLE